MKGGKVDVDLTERFHALSGLPGYLAKVTALKLDPSNFAVVTTGAGNNYRHILCKSCNMNIPGSEANFESHLNEKHNSPFPQLDKFILNQAKQVADNPAFFETLKDDSRFQNAIKGRVKRLVEDVDFISSCEKEHPEKFEQAAKKMAKTLIFEHIKTLE